MASVSEAGSTRPPICEMHDPVPYVNTRVTWSGASQSQGNLFGDLVPGGTGADEARSMFGVDGSGVRIGIIANSFDATVVNNPTVSGGGASFGVTSGELPGFSNPFGFTTPVQILKEDMDLANTDEGRAMAEIIHDLAPGAELLFHSAFNNINTGEPEDDRSIARAIDALVAAGVDIIVDDVAYLISPYFQDGQAAAAVDRAYDAGVTYISAVGNLGSEAWIGTYSPTTMSGGRPRHNFDLSPGEDDTLDIQVPPFRSTRVVVQWDSPYPSVSGRSDFTDFNAFLIDGSGVILDTSANLQRGGADPYEVLKVQNSSPSFLNTRLVIEQVSVRRPNVQIKVLVERGTIVDSNDQNAPTSFGQAAANGALAVGAVYWASGLPSPQNSTGPAFVALASDGTRINETRPKPNVSSTHGVNTSFFPFLADSPDDSDNFPNFFGSSAAAPHVAALAGLYIHRYRQLVGNGPMVDQVHTAIIGSARPVPGGTPNNVGAGLAEAGTLLDCFANAAARGCPVDLDATSQYDAADITLAKSLLAAQDITADVHPAHGNGVLDFFDFATFVNNADSPCWPAP